MKMGQINEIYQCIVLSEVCFLLYVVLSFAQSLLYNYNIRLSCL